MLLNTELLPVIAEMMSNNSITILSGLSLLAGAIAGTAFYVLTEKKAQASVRVMVLRTLISIVGGFIFGILLTILIDAKPPKIYAVFGVCGLTGFYLVTRYIMKSKDKDGNLEDLIK